MDGFDVTGMTYERRLLELAASDPDLVVLTAENRAAIRGVPAELGERFIDVGIAEQTLVGAAAGLALRGRTPIIHALAAFLTMRAFEFVRTNVGIPRLPVKLVGFVPGFLSDANGPTHQAVEDIALMRGIPGMRVFCPADEEDLVRELPSLIRDRHPCYVRYNARKAVPRPLDGAAPTNDFTPGRAEVVREGTDATILSVGFLLEQALDASDRLEAAGLRVGVVNVRWVEPLDGAAVLGAALRSRTLFTLEDHFVRGGLHSAVLELLSRERITAAVHPIALSEGWFRPGLLDDVLSHAGFTGKTIAARIQAAFRTPSEPRVDRHDVQPY
jgi:transketolase